MSTPSILDEAKKIVGGDRQQDYGSCIESFERIAKLWTAYKGTDFTALDVAMMMTLLKVSRSKTSPKRDTFVDIAGYAECAGQITAPAQAADFYVPKSRVTVTTKPPAQPGCLHDYPTTRPDVRATRGCEVCQWADVCQAPAGGY